MNNEKLEQGNKLKNEIESLQRELNYWQDAEGAVVKLDIKAYSNYVEAKNDSVNFDVLKACAIQGISKRLAIAQEQYEKL